jgi:hypothetical protein
MTPVEQRDADELVGFAFVLGAIAGVAAYAIARRLLRP